MKDKSGVMAAIMAAIDQHMEEEMAVPPPTPGPGVSLWKYYGLGEMMRLRTLWQLRIGGGAGILLRPRGSV